MPLGIILHYYHNKSLIEKAGLVSQKNLRKFKVF